MAFSGDGGDGLFGGDDTYLAQEAATRWVRLPEMLRHPRGSTRPNASKGGGVTMHREFAYSIVIPARNEEETIGEVLQGLKGMTDDLIVVDGQSSDATIAIATQYGARVIQDNGRGKGDAVRVGLAHARHPVTVFIDADGSHDVADIPKLVAPIAAAEADLVMGSRMLGGSEELFGSLTEVIRLIGSLVISLSINYRFGVRLTDYQNGFRAIRTDVARSIGLRSDITTIEQEMAMKCLANGYRVAERPTHESARRGGVSKIHVMSVAHIYVWNLINGVMTRRRRAPHVDVALGERAEATLRTDSLTLK